MMRNNTSSGRLAICLIALFLAADDLSADVVMLRNGSLIEGKVDILGDQIVIDTGTSRMRLSRREVEDVVKTRPAAYEVKRARIAHPTADQHLNLAEWCLRQDLLPQAARELNDARVRDSRQPGLGELESRLAAAIRASQRQDIVPESPEVVPADLADDELRELEKMAEQLDPQVIEQFTKQIQPLVINSCGTANCHMTGSDSGYELNRDWVRDMANRRSTLNNLRSTLAQVDLRDPARSPLIVIPAAAHASLRGPVFRGRHEKLHEKMVDWVYLAAGVSRDLPAAEAAIETGLPMTQDAEVGATALPTIPDDLDIAPSGNVYSPEAIHFWEREQPAPVRRGSQVVAGTPPIRDEFDPEIFNRQQP